MEETWTWHKCVFLIYRTMSIELKFVYLRDYIFYSLFINHWLLLNLHYFTFTIFWKLNVSYLSLDKFLPLYWNRRARKMVHHRVTSDWKVWVVLGTWFVSWYLKFETQGFIIIHYVGISPIYLFQERKLFTGGQ